MIALQLSVHSRAPRQRAQDAARLALRCLHAELVLYPKPGLVSLRDNGSHQDMNALSFLRGLGALRHYFRAIYHAGRQKAGFSRLKILGQLAETRMLAATGGVNTHRGAIFSIGLLGAALGASHTSGRQPDAAALRETLLEHWGADLRTHACVMAGDSHGLQVARQHQVSGAREEGALGLPSVFDVALPVLRQRLGAGASETEARVDTLFALMAHISDTNVYHRGGAEGAHELRSEAQAFLRAGGTGCEGWQARAEALHAHCKARRLSPGGAADLLAATLFVHAATA